MRRYFDKARKLYLTAGATAAALVAGSVPAWAVGVENTVVSGAFTQLAEDIAVTIGACVTAVVGIAVIILGFRYGRKLLSSIAK